MSLRCSGGRLFPQIAGTVAAHRETAADKGIGGGRAEANDHLEEEGRSGGGRARQLRSCFRRARQALVLGIGRCFYSGFHSKISLRATRLPLVQVLNTIAERIDSLGQMPGEDTP